MNILVIKHGSLGDIFLSVGTIQSIRQHYPDARLFLLTQSNYKNILNKFPDVVKYQSCKSPASTY